MGLKKCSNCNMEKQKTEFSKANASKDGLMHYCRKCNTDRASKWNKENKERLNKRHREKGTNRTQIKKDSALYYKYGLTVTEYEEILEKQEGVCAICKKFRLRGKQSRMHVDHCHSTNKIRGILCAYCNNAVGKFEDDINRLKEAIKYLQKEK